MLYIATSPEPLERHMADLHRPLVAEWTVGCAGLAVALAAASAASQRRQAEIAWTQRQARIVALRRASAAQRACTAALARETAFMNAKADALAAKRTSRR